VEKIITHDSTQNKCFECEILEQEGIISCAWHGNSQDLDQTKIASSSIVRLLKRTGFTKVLDDNRQGYGEWPDLTQWLKSEWVPELLNTKITAYAHVLSPDFSSKIPASNIFNQIIDGVDFVTFDSYSTALNWLKHR